MARTLVFLYGLVCYLGFLAVFLYLIGFLGNFVVPKTVDSGEAGSLALALAVNLALILFFGLQHTIMARPTFKAWWTRFVPAPAERPTYLMATNLILALFYWQWRPMPGVIWDVQVVWGQTVLWGAFALGWLLVLVSTLQINHFDLFGLRQVWLYLRGREYTNVKLATPLLYRFVRHPLYVGWIIAFWATPAMTVGHALFAAGMTGYMLIAIWFEERNLLEFHGQAYAEYRRRVPMLVPRFTRQAVPDDQG